MAFHAELMDTQTKRNPISTLDDAVMWLASINCAIEIVQGDEDRTFLFIETRDGDEAAREIGDGGFDARGTLMMATRELWEMVNG